jgi:mono/diheme cytochrome c family protein
MKIIIEALALTSVISLAIPALAIDVDQKMLQGTALYEKHCASCHEVAATNAPTRASLGAMSAAVILQEMTRKNEAAGPGTQQG